MIYVATPYRHPDLELRIERYKAAVHVVAVLANAGVPVYSPIVHWHPVQLEHNLSFDTNDQWQNLDIPMMDLCAMGLFVQIPGWQDSKGMLFERDYFERRHKLVHWVQYDPHEIERFANFYPWRLA